MLKPAHKSRPEVSANDVKEIFYELYDLEVKNMRQLNGYDDVNFYVTVTNNDNPCDGGRCEDAYVFKVMNLEDSEEPDVIDAQTCLLQHLGDSGIICSKPVPNKEGHFFSTRKFSSGEHIVRVFEFISGTILHNLTCTPSIFYKVGRFAAELDLAMQNFGHSAFLDHKTIWMFPMVPDLYEYLFAVDREDRKLLVQEVLKEFIDNVMPLTDSLESGMIHGDFNEQNILMEQVNGEWEVKAVIDFGDSQLGCYLFELAITMAYMILQGGDAEVGGYVLSGYKTVRPVPEEEFKLLKVCVATRLCISLVMGAYTNFKDPTNTYVLTTAAHGWKVLEELWRKDGELMIVEWKALANGFAAQMEYVHTS